MAKRKPVWNTDPNAKSFYELNAKGDAVAYHSIAPGESVKMPKHERERLIADGGWTDKKPQAVKDAEKAAKEALESRIEAAKVEIATALDELETIGKEGD